MTQLLLSSKTIVTEESPGVVSIQALPTSITAIVAVTEYGPEEATLSPSLDEWIRQFGRITANAQDGPLFADGFYNNGGQFLWTKRVLHYTDISSPATKQGAKSTKTIQTAGGVPTAGSVTGTNTEPFAFVDGDDITIAIDAFGDDTATFNAAAASVTSSNTGPYALTDLWSFTYDTQDGTQTIVFNAAEFVAIGAATAEEVAAVINAESVGIQATVVANAVVITTDQLGTDATLGTFADVTGTAVAVLGFTGASDTGTGDAADSTAVTVAELKLLIEGDIPNLTINDVGGAVQIVSDTTGTSSIVTVNASSSMDDELGVDNATHTGTSGAAANTLTVEGKWIGTYADAYTIEIEAATSGDADAFDLTVIEAGFIVEPWPNLKIGTADAANAQYCETVVNDVNSGSDLIQLTDELAAAASPDNLPAVGSYSMTGGDDGLTSLDDNDFIGHVTTQTGLRGFDTKTGIRLLAVPARATAAVQNAMLTYVEDTRNGEMFCILDPPANQSYTQIVTYVETTASLLESSEYGAIYWPRVKVLNPRKDIFGQVANITVAPSGILCGMIARTDAIGGDGRGVYLPPAGTERGILKGVVGFETDEVLREEIRDYVFPKRINPLTTEDGLPLYCDGELTLKSDGNFPTVPERRGAIHIEQSIKRGTTWARHSNNDAALRGRIERTSVSFLVGEMKKGAFRSQDQNEAFFFDIGEGLNTEAVIFTGKVIARVGLATQKPALFVVFRFSQDTRKIEEALAGAA